MLGGVVPLSYPEPESGWPLLGGLFVCGDGLPKVWESVPVVGVAVSVLVDPLLF